MPDTDNLGEWEGSNNPFMNPMTRSIRDGYNISIAINDILNSKKMDGPMQMTMFMNYKVGNDALVTIAGERSSSDSQQPVYTAEMVAAYKLMQPKMESFKNLTIPIHDTTTMEYKLFFNSMEGAYQGTYTERSNYVLSIAVSMHEYLEMAAVEALVRAYYTTLTGKRSDQHNAFNEVGGNSTAIKAQLVVNAGLADQCLGYAKVIFATVADPLLKRTSINSFFPLALMHVKVKTEYTQDIPEHDTEFLCNHIWKAGEKAKVTIVGSDVSVGSSYDRKTASLRPVVFHEGAPVTTDPFTNGWDLTQKNMVGTNLTGLPSHIVIEIIKP